MSPFIVCEISANHLGSLDRALEIVQAAAKSGANAVKVQTWTPGTMCLDRSFILSSGPWAGRHLHELYEETHTPWSWHPVIFDYARSLGMVPFSAAFDKPSVDFLEELGVDRHKVASFEITDTPLIRYMATKGKPMIISTGMASPKEIEDACSQVDADQQITLLKCTSAYPADEHDANLSTALDWAGVDWGVSDHTLGIGVAVAAVAMGATYVEKHLTLKRSDGGPDAGFSLEPDEFKAMAVACRQAAAAIGTPTYKLGRGESTALRRSLWVTKPVKAGQPLRLGDNVATARPAHGMPPSTNLAGKIATRDLHPNTPLTAEDIG